LNHMLEITLATHCAPVLFGKKPAAVLSKPTWWNRLSSDAEAMTKNRLRFMTLTRPRKNHLIFIYDPILLDRTLRGRTVRRELRAMGYPVSGGLATCLTHLAKRVKASRDFPHEIGFFLGYQAEDVIGFIRHRGAHCKMCGMWKVYSDVARAEALFAEYERCKSVLLARISSGGSICDDSNLIYKAN